jgi:hypothetical protein
LTGVAIFVGPYIREFAGARPANQPSKMIYSPPADPALTRNPLFFTTS